MDHSPQSTPRSKRRPAIVMGAVAATLVVAVTAWTLAPRATKASGPDAARLSIAVVPPVEPVFVAGDVLEVGTLRDGFDRAALERQPQMADTEYRPPDAYAGEPWSEPQALPGTMGRPPAGSTEVAVITSTDPLADGSRLFGFDRRPALPVAAASTTEGEPPPTDTATASQSFFQ